MRGARDGWQREPRSRRAHVLCGALVVTAALLLSGCGPDGPSAICEDQAGARLCLVRRGKAYRMTLDGLKPGSVLRMEGGTQPLTLTIGPDGKTPPPGGVLGFLPADCDGTTQVEVVSRLDLPVVFRVTWQPPAGGKGPCTPHVETA